jgi:hypothetical protein
MCSTGRIPARGIVRRPALQQSPESLPAAETNLERTMQLHSVVIKGDPSQKIDDIENVEMVFKDGKGYDSKKLIDSVQGWVGFR